MAERNLRGDDIVVYYKEQATKGEVPANPDFTPIRRTSGKAVKALSFVQSEEVKANRQGKPNIVDTKDISFELSAETTKQSIFMLGAALQSNLVSSTVTSSTISFTATGMSSTAADFASFDEGDYIFVTGSGTAADNRTYYITTKTSDSAIVTSPAPDTVVAAGDSITVTSNKFVSGSTQRYFVIQNRTKDTSRVGEIAYETYYDQQVGSANIEIGESGIIGNTVNFAGDSESEVSGFAAVAGQTDNAADTSDVLSATNNVTRFWQDGVPLQCLIKTMSLEVSNNLIDDPAAGCGTERVNGDFTASASITARNRIDDSMRWKEDYHNQVTHEYAVELKHNDTDFTIIQVGKGKITEHSMPDGNNTVATSEMTVAGEEDSRGITVAVYKNW